MPPEFLPVLQPWLAALGGFSAIAVLLVTAAYGLFRLFGVKWLDSKFAERLASYKHAQQKELERLKLEINTLMDRTVKLHQREFDVLPEVWSRVNDAVFAMQPVGLGFQEYPDVNRLTDPQFEHLLESSELDDWQKEELRLAGDRTRYYREAKAPIDLRKGDAARREFSIYFSKNGIFIPEPLEAQFSAIDALLLEVVVERQVALRHGKQIFDKGIILHEKGRGMLKALGTDLKSRLWNAHAIDSAKATPGSAPTGITRAYQK